VDQVTVLHPNTLVVLSFLVQSNIGELLLEFESVTHLIKQESNHDVAPSTVRLEALCFSSFYASVELVTVRQGGREVGADEPSKVEPWVDPTFISLFIEGSVVSEIIFVINSPGEFV